MLQVPLTKSQKQAAKKKSQTPVVKAAKSDALKKAKLARVSHRPRIDSYDVSSCRD